MRNFEIVHSTLICTRNSISDFCQTNKCHQVTVAGNSSPTVILALVVDVGLYGYGYERDNGKKAGQRSQDGGHDVEGASSGAVVLGTLQISDHLLVSGLEEPKHNVVDSQLSPTSGELEQKTLSSVSSSPENSVNTEMMSNLDYSTCFLLNDFCHDLNDCFYLKSSVRSIIFSHQLYSKGQGLGGGFDQIVRCSSWVRLIFPKVCCH